MAEYERINFRKDYYEKISEFLAENPALGFQEDDVKQFIKFSVNRTKHQVEQDKEILEEL